MNPGRSRHKSFVPHRFAFVLAKGENPQTSIVSVHEEH
jgi:hypothetical protein